MKRLYDKAYPGRDHITRDEDLLRRFLGGLFDEQVKLLVEFVKRPQNIDDAVVEVIGFLDTRKSSQEDKRQKRQGRVRFDSEYSEASENDFEIVRAVSKAPPPGRKGKQDVPSKQSIDSVQTDDKGPSGDPKQIEDRVVERIVALLPVILQREAAKQVQRPANLQFPANKNGNAKGVFKGNSSGPGPGTNNQSSGQMFNQGGPRYGACFKCGREGHFARDCWTFTSQLHVTPGDDCHITHKESGDVRNDSPNGNGSPLAVTGRSNQTFHKQS